MPLEPTRAFPSRLLPLVRALTGGTTATYTTGPATRLALTAAGAHGATTRTTVHLPAEPDRSDVGLLAHELSHTRNPLVRPRFSLRAPGGSIDADERAAQSTGIAARRAVTAGIGGIAADLPVGAAAGGALGLVEAATQAARDAVRDEVERALSTVHHAMAPATAGTPPSGSADGSAGQTPDDRVSPQASSAAPAAPAGSAALGGQAGAGRQPSLEQIVRAIEERVLHQLERRGGRYAGTF